MTMLRRPKRAVVWVVLLTIAPVGGVWVAVALGMARHRSAGGLVVVEVLFGQPASGGVGG